MSTVAKPSSTAKVDFLVDENGNPIELERDTTVGAASDVEPTVGATGPTNWWRLGLVALGVLVAILLVLQLVSGDPGTAVIPGSPVAAPQTTSPAPAPSVQ